MNPSNVYFTDFHTIAFGDSLPTKLKKLIKKAGIENLDLDGKFVAIKMHFGELGNISYLRPNYARAVVDVVKELGGKPFLTDCNTMYPGSRKTALEHMECAWENGFTPLTVGCPIIIGDGLKGTDDVDVPVEGGEYVKAAKIGRAVMDADVFISLTHFKGHESTGFGGAIKNIGMGCGSRAGKTEQHSSGKPHITPELCRGCRKCQKEYAIYVARVRKYTSEMNLNDAVARAIDECIKEGILVEFLRKNRSEVKMVSILEYDKEWEEKKLRKAEYEAGRSEGIEIGKSEGIEIGKTEGIEIGKSKGIEIGRDKAMAEFVCNMIKYGFSIEKIAEVTGKNAEQIQTILNQQAP